MFSRHSSGSNTTRNRMLHSIRFMRVPPSIYRYFFGSCRRHVLCHLLMHDRWVDQNYSPNQRWYNQKGNKNIDCRSSHLDSSQNGMGRPPDWKTWASRQQQENEKVSDKKPILFATIIIISLIAVENGIFLEATPPFYDFCAETCKQLFASLALKKINCYSFKIPIMMILLSLVDILPLISLLQQFTFMGLCFPT